MVARLGVRSDDRLWRSGPHLAVSDSQLYARDDHRDIDRCRRIGRDFLGAPSLYGYPRAQRGRAGCSGRHSRVSRGDSDRKRVAGARLDLLVGTTVVARSPRRLTLSAALPDPGKQEIATGLDESLATDWGYHKKGMLSKGFWRWRSK